MRVAVARTCPHCGKLVAPDRQRLCDNCGEDFTVGTPTPPAVADRSYRGVSDDDALRQAEADAMAARQAGFEVDSQSWTEDQGVRVLSVKYRQTRGGPLANPASGIVRGFFVLLVIIIVLYIAIRQIG